MRTSTRVGMASYSTPLVPQPALVPAHSHALLGPSTHDREAVGPRSHHRSRCARLDRHKPGSRSRCVTNQRQGMSAAAAGRFRRPSSHADSNAHKVQHTSSQECPAPTQYRAKPNNWQSQTASQLSSLLLQASCSTALCAMPPSLRNTPKRQGSHCEGW